MTLWSSVAYAGWFSKTSSDTLRLTWEESDQGQGQINSRPNEKDARISSQHGADPSISAFVSQSLPKISPQWLSEIIIIVCWLQWSNILPLRFLRAGGNFTCSSCPMASKSSSKRDLSMASISSLSAWGSMTCTKFSWKKKCKEKTKKEKTRGFITLQDFSFRYLEFGHSWADHQLWWKDFLLRRLDMSRVLQNALTFSKDSYNQCDPQLNQYTVYSTVPNNTGSEFSLPP